MSRHFISKYKFPIFVISLIVIYVMISHYVKNNLISYGIKSQRIRFGQTVPLTGSIGEVGYHYHMGIILGFQYLNLRGGVKDHLLELYVLDDNFDQQHAVENTRILVEYYDVFAMVGTIGAEISSAVSRYLAGNAIPFIGPLTGYTELHQAFDRYTIYIRPSYDEELGVIFSYLKRLGLRNISLFHSKDEYGDTILSHLQANVIEEPSFQLISTGSYQTQDNLIDGALASILQIPNPFRREDVSQSPVLSQIQAVIVAASTSQAKLFIDFIKNYRPDIYIFCFSEVDTEALSILLAEIKSDRSVNYTNIFCTGVVPMSNNNINREIDEQIKIRGVDISFTPTLVEGYLVGRFIGAVIDQIPGRITRNSFINMIYQKGTIEINGIPFGPFIDTVDPQTRQVIQNNHAQLPITLMTLNQEMQFVPLNFNNKVYNNV